MYKSFNVVLAIIVIIVNVVIIALLNKSLPINIHIYVVSLCVFMIWLDGKIDTLIDSLNNRK